jgi:uncharacterized protein (TIGR03382 family)
MLRRMRRIALGILLLSATASAGTVSTPIIGGTPTTEGQYPNVVVFEAGGGLCTGTLITPDWVLTAAHCIQGASPTSVRVHFATVNLNKDQGVTRLAKELFPHPMFSQSALGRHDIGLIKLSMSVNDVIPAPVNLVKENAPIGLAVTMVGFGTTATNGGAGSIGVQYVVNQTVTACSSFAGSNDNLLCYSQTNGTGKCNGDSGGPSFAMIGGRLTQVGITSFGDMGCTQFGADTRTDAEKDWLLMHIPTLECTNDDECGMGNICFNKKCIVTPFADTGLGSTCTGNTDCESGMCASDGETGYCSMGCMMGAEGTCPEGLECTEAGGGGVCWPTDTGGGCCDASGAGGPTALLAFGFLGLVLGRKRRRR